MTDELELELATFNRLLSSLIGTDEGKYALILGEDLIGTYGTYEDALNVGYSRAKLKPFLVKKISGAENVAYFSRDFSSSPCLTYQH